MEIVVNRTIWYSSSTQAANFLKNYTQEKWLIFSDANFHLRKNATKAKVLIFSDAKWWKRRGCWCELSLENLHPKVSLRVGQQQQQRKGRRRRKSSRGKRKRSKNLKIWNFQWVDQWVCTARLERCKKKPREKEFKSDKEESEQAAKEPTHHGKMMIFLFSWYLAELTKTVR